MNFRRLSGSSAEYRLSTDKLGDGVVYTAGTDVTVSDQRALAACHRIAS